MVDETLSVTQYFPKISYGHIRFVDLTLCLLRKGSDSLSNYQLFTLVKVKYFHI